MKYTKAQLEKYDLLDKSYWDYISNKYEEAILFDDANEARNIADLIDQWYRANPEAARREPEVHNDYQTIKWRLCWTALTYLDNKRTIQLYAGHINDLRQMFDKIDIKEAFDFAFYFQEKLRLKLQNILIFQDRDTLKENIREALYNNQEVLFNAPLVIEDKKEKSTIANWFKLYVLDVGSGELDKLKQTEFFSKNKFYTALNPEQQEILKTIYNTYERIKISSFKEQGIETEVSYEDQKGEGTLIYGQLERYDSKKVKEFDDFIKWREKTTGQEIFPEEEELAPPAGISMPAPASGQAGTEEYLPVTMAGAEDTPKPPRRIDNIDAVYQGLTKSKADIDSSKINIKVADPDGVVADLIKANKLAFKSPELQQRFENLCRTFLRGVRSGSALISALTRPEANGGMDYDINKASALREIIEEMAADPKYQVFPEKVEAEKIEDVKDMPTFAQAQGRMKTAASATPKGVISLEHLPKKIKPVSPPAPKVEKPKAKPAMKPKKEYMPVAPAAPPSKPKANSIEGPGPTPKPKAPKPIPKKAKPVATPSASRGAPMPRLRRMAPTDRPVVTDVKIPAPMVMGPIDELQHMDLAEFRTLGADPEHGIETLLEKVDLLLEQGVTEKSKGIQAWKKSPLNKEYLDIGQKSMDAGQSVEEYILARQKNDPNAMSLEEFDAIADLNKNLRF